MQRLAAAAGLARHEWPPSLLRRMWEALLEHEAGRKTLAHTRSPLAELAWLTRSARVTVSRSMIGASPRRGSSSRENWRMARRACKTSGGFSAADRRGLTSGQQRALAEPLLAPLRAMHKRLTTGKGAGDLSFASQESSKFGVLLGALELFAAGDEARTRRNESGTCCPRKTHRAPRGALWTLGRVAARVPVAGPLNVILGGETAEAWLAALLDHPLDEPLLAWTVMQLARKTGDRYRDVRPAVRTRVVTC